MVVVGLLVVVVSAVAVSAAIASFSGSKSEHWGVIYRNTIGSPVGELRDGPYGSIGHTGPQSEPPFGKGSLGIEVANVPGSTEKVAFGNEVDFFGDNFLDLTQVGYRVFQTGEDTSHGGLSNLPNITFELDANLNALPADNYTSLVWNPAPNDPGNVDQWSPYIDATTTGQWNFTGAEGAATGCNQTTTCTFAQIKTALADGGDAPAVLSVAIAKGRDNEFQGAVDGLRLNNKVYDFERDGTKEKGA